MDTREAIANRIRQLCKERGITPNGLSYFISDTNAAKIFAGTLDANTIIPYGKN